MTGPRLALPLVNLTSAAMQVINDEAGRQGVSRRELSRRSGVERSRVDRYLSGKNRKVDLEDAALMAAALDLDLPDVMSQAADLMRAEGVDVFTANMSSEAREAVEGERGARG